MSYFLSFLMSFLPIYRYKEEKGTLVVTVVKCEDLPVKDTTLMTCDPYVKLQLLPEKQQRVKTRVLRHIRQPVYDEDFTFYGVQPNQLQVRDDSFFHSHFDGLDPLSRGDEEVIMTKMMNSLRN
jgi:hypothetical protein